MTTGGGAGTDTGRRDGGARVRGGEGHALVIGGSIAGLAAARVLADRFARVTVLDRDALPREPGSRRGVPHGDHGHALLLRGRRQLEEFFPGLGGELLAAGAVSFDPGHDLVMHQMGSTRRRFRGTDRGISLTRAALEAGVRRRVTALAGVTIRDRSSVVALTGGPRRVTGVELDTGETLRADVVVNASGRGGSEPDALLRRLGAPVPAMDVVKVDVGYTTRLYHRRPGERLAGDALLHLMAGARGDKRAAAVFAVEGDRWMVTLGGWHRAHAPTDPAGFEDFAARLPGPTVAELVATAEPVASAPIRKFTFPAARRRRFERMGEVPGGYVVLGDASCSLNPLYGQGMTMAALQAAALGRSLDRAGHTGPAMVRAQYRATARIVDGPWRMATGQDFTHPETVGPRPRGTALLTWYTERVVLASHVSEPVNRTLMDVQQLLAPPGAVLRPGTALRALAAARRSPALAAGVPRT
ncbi:NAD(P)/FAD-dependent oxidoreductase (plasmid) [Streptomyces sp. BI20]|uniref:NAD(P)/FAD-dependent oxidoreductase n=1 Tax=Streptomyces sp. BI20 TaxID=3403460 RepID=UPI003C7235C7